MGFFKMKGRGISARVAEQMRMGIALGELAYNLYIKDDLKEARKIMVKASKMSKHTYLAAIHTVVNCLTLQHR